MIRHNVDKKHHVKSFAELHDVLSCFRKSLDWVGWIFRGQNNIDWPLIPKAGRGKFSALDDKLYFEEWKTQAIQYITKQPKDDWEWLAIAQHHGLATRLLDWTFNPLAAAFFAVSENLDADAALFAFSPTSLVLTEHTNPINLGEKGVFVYKPKHVVPRITRQSGIFTIHHPPTLPLDQAQGEYEQLELIIIDRNYRNELVCELAQYGINKATLFPDLDGLSEHINWMTINHTYQQLAVKV